MPLGYVVHRCDAKSISIATRTQLPNHVRRYDKEIFKCCCIHKDEIEHVPARLSAMKCTTRAATSTRVVTRTQLPKMMREVAH